MLALTALAHQIVTPRDVIDEKNIIAEENYRLSETHAGDLVVFGKAIGLDAASQVTAAPPSSATRFASAGKSAAI